MIFYICSDHRCVTIPANIKKSFIRKCVINRLMSILFSFQSRNFIKLNKKHTLKNHIVVLFYLLQRNCLGGVFGDNYGIIFFSPP